jgi:hypothetical protein
MSRARMAAALPAAAVLILALAACGIGGPEVSSRARCEGPAFTSEKMPTAPARTLVALDLSDNGEEARADVIESIDPILSRAVAEGGVVRLLVSGGEGQPVSVSPCLDGSSTIMVDRNNEETERLARDTAIEAIEGSVSALLEETEISPRSDLSNLLAEVPGQLGSLRATAASEQGPATVVMVSDLTSPAARGDCLDLDGVRATRAVADAMVVRCLETGQFRRLPAGVALRIVRPQVTPGDNAGARMSGYLLASLCARMTDEKGGCAPESARGG